jgi:uncharacterized protein YprB with RNaseH-like and TPR domain
MKTLAFDLEMSNLSANFGMILCGGFKEIGAKEAVTMYDLRATSTYDKEPWHDEELALDIKKELTNADILVSYNGRRFDIPFLNSRLVKYGHKPIIGVKHIDLFFVSKFQLKLNNWSLDALAKHLGCKTQKTHMEGEQWTRAMTGDQDAFDYIVTHCIQDVKVLEQVFYKVKGLVKFIKD